MFCNRKNFIFIKESEQNDVSLELLRLCALERSNITLYVSIEKPNFTCNELNIIPLEALENVIFTHFSGNVEVFKSRLWEIHLTRRKPHTIIFEASAAAIPRIIFIVSAIFSYVNFLPENVRSILTINKSVVNDDVLKKLTDLYYRETNVFTDFEYLKQRLSNM
ncbi:hypothetical protein ACFFRR_003365 [Megaselia abdita]